MGILCSCIINDVSDSSVDVQGRRRMSNSPSRRRHTRPEETRADIATGDPDSARKEHRHPD